MNVFDTEFFGKYDIASHFSRCESCHRLTLLSTYSTTRFVKLFSVPFLPTGWIRMIDECPHCGHRGTVSARKYAHDRKHNLAMMMEGFASDADNPDNCAHALRTLMVYDESAWFNDVQKSYGLRFETNGNIQLMIAQGLCRFGDYRQAMTYCRKAIVLSAGRPAEQLLAFCESLMEATENNAHIDALRVVPESARRAYIPVLSMATAIAIGAISVGISSLRNYKAWIVNGSLRAYSFSLDNETHSLQPGDCRQIKLRLGEHVLNFGSKPPNQFTYSIPLIKQLLNKQLLVINPDATALLAMAANHAEAGGPQTTFSYGEQIRILPGLRQSLRGIRKLKTNATNTDAISLYRPDTHLEMVRLMQSLGLDAESVDYARSALADNASPDEFTELLAVALDRAGDADALAFLNTKLATTPSLLPWHLYYQNYMMIHHPEHNLEQEYTLRCKNHPDEPESYYLLGRVVQDPPTAYKFLDYSEKLGGMNGRGYHAIARDLFIRGSFGESLPYSEKALAGAPGNREFIQLNEQILLAMGNYDALLEKTRSADPAKTDPDLPRRTVLYLTGAGYHREAEAAAEQFSQQDEQKLPGLNAVRFYAVGNMDEYLDCLAAANNPHAKLEELLHRNRIADADALLSQSEEQDYREHLVLYCAAMDQRQRQIAEKNLAQAIAGIDRKTVGRFRVAELLSGQRECTLDAIRTLDIDAPEKALLCVALGFSHPEMQKQLNELAMVYNFEPAYPQLLLRRWIRSAAIRQAA